MRRDAAPDFFDQTELFIDGQSVDLVHQLGVGHRVPPTHGS
jgi:hypothetical protein